MGQDKRQIANLETALIEVVKYGSKIFTEPDLNKKGEGKCDPKIYVAALDNIFNSMQGLRIFERFGFNFPKGTRLKTQRQQLQKSIMNGFIFLNITIGLILKMN